MNQDHNSMCMCETYVTEEELKYITLRSRQLRTQEQQEEQKLKLGTQEQKEKQVKENSSEAGGWVTVKKRNKKQATENWERDLLNIRQLKRQTEKSGWFF